MKCWKDVTLTASTLERAMFDCGLGGCGSWERFTPAWPLFPPAEAEGSQGGSRGEPLATPR